MKRKSISAAILGDFIMPMVSCCAALSSSARSIGEIMKHRLVSSGVLLLAVSVAACGNVEQESKNRAAEEQRLLAEKAKEKVDAAAKSERDQCSALMAEQKNRYHQLAAAGDYWGAASTIRSCVRILNDKTMQSMLEDAEVRNYIALINNKNSDAQSRLIALDSFAVDYPEKAIPFKKLRVQLSEKDKQNTRSSEIAAAKVSSANSGATCSNSEYGIYQQYDKFLDANPSTPDYELRTVFARKVGMQPSALKNLYIRCTMRWSEQSPSESNAYLKKELEGFAKDCAKQPGNDPYCKSGLGR